MSDNYYSYCFDEAAKSKKFYTNLTEDDVAYLEAANRRDFDTCSGLLDKYFRQKMPNTVCRHQVWRRDNKKDIWVYQIHRKHKSDAGWLGEGVYFYGVEEEALKALEYGIWCNAFFINVENCFTMDRDLHNEIVHKNDTKVSARMTKFLEKNKMDGVFWAGDMREEWCVLSPEQIKRADITRDDEGRIIPISLRFDLSKKDNRY